MPANRKDQQTRARFSPAAVVKFVNDLYKLRNCKEDCTQHMFASIRVMMIRLVSYGPGFDPLQKVSLLIVTKEQ